MLTKGPSPCQHKERNMNNIAAVVVTYNRKKLLKECIEALKASTRKVDVIIIDNNSTDGTREYIADLVGKDVIYKRLKKNLGGAGGFSAGMKYAVKKGYEYIWIMDDDTIVKEDSLEQLMRVAGSIHNNFGFLSSSVRWIDGSDCKMNMPTYKTNLTDYERVYAAKGIYPVKAATFVSLLLIIVLSDIEYMIISDGVLIVSAILLMLEIFLIYDIKTLGYSILNGLIAFLIMFLLRLFGNFMFKKDTMGGGDIKLMFIFGLVLDYKMAILSIFIGSIIGLPISLILIKNKSNHEVPFGPFLSLGALIILLFQLNLDKLLEIYK